MLTAGYVTAWIAAVGAWFAYGFTLVRPRSQELTSPEGVVVYVPHVAFFLVGLAEHTPLGTDFAEILAWFVALVLGVGVFGVLFYEHDKEEPDVSLWAAACGVWGAVSLAAVVYITLESVIPLVYFIPAALGVGGAGGVATVFCRDNPAVWFPVEMVFLAFKSVACSMLMWMSGRSLLGETANSADYNAINALTDPGNSFWWSVVAAGAFGMVAGAGVYYLERIGRDGFHELRGHRGSK